MPVIILAIVLALIAGAVVISYGYRRGGMILIGAVVATVVVLIWYARIYQGGQTGVLQVSDLELTNLEMELAYRDSYRITGRLFNRSDEHTLRSLTIEITVSDCTAPDDCVVVGQQSQLVSVDVPPGQARDFERQYQFSRFEFNGEVKLDYELSGVRSD